MAIPDAVSVELWVAIRTISSKAPISAKISSEFDCSESIFIWDWETNLAH